MTHVKRTRVRRLTHFRRMLISLFGRRQEAQPIRPPAVRCASLRRRAWEAATSCSLPRAAIGSYQLLEDIPLDRGRVARMVQEDLLLGTDT